MTENQRENGTLEERVRTLTNWRETRRTSNGALRSGDLERRAVEIVVVVVVVVEGGSVVVWNL